MSVQISVTPNHNTYTLNVYVYINDICNEVVDGLPNNICNQIDDIIKQHAFDSVDIRIKINNSSNVTIIIDRNYTVRQIILGQMVAGDIKVITPSMEHPPIIKYIEIYRNSNKITLHNNIVAMFCVTLQQPFATLLQSIIDNGLIVQNIRYKPISDHSEDIPQLKQIKTKIFRLLDVMHIAHWKSYVHIIRNKQIDEIIIQHPLISSLVYDINRDKFTVGELHRFKRQWDRMIGHEHINNK